MHKHVTLFGGDEAEALRVVEPLHVSGCSHLESPFCVAFGDSNVSVGQSTDVTYLTAIRRSEFLADRIRSPAMRRTTIGIALALAAAFAYGDTFSDIRAEITKRHDEAVK